MVRTKVWEFMSVVSPLSSRILLNLVTAWLVFGTGFACLGTWGLIPWHPHVGGVVPCLFHHLRLCLLPPWHAPITTKGLTLLASPVSLVGLGVLLPRGGAQPPWTIKPGSKVPLPVLSWLSALAGRFGVSGEDPQLLVGGNTGGSGDNVLAAQCLLLPSLSLRCLLFLPGGSSESVSECCRLVEEWETGRRNGCSPRLSQLLGEG